GQPTKAFRRVQGPYRSRAGLARPYGFPCIEMVHHGFCPDLGGKTPQLVRVDMVFHVQEFFSLARSDYPSIEEFAPFHLGNHPDDRIFEGKSILHLRLLLPEGPSWTIWS